MSRLTTTDNPSTSGAESVHLNPAQNNDEESGSTTQVMANGRNNTNMALYSDFSLYTTLNLISRQIRVDALTQRGRIIDSSIKSSHSWMRTIFVIKERAFDKFFVPWFLVTINTIVWSIIIHIYKDRFILRLETVTSLYNLVLTTALAFLLVFRLNRVAIRWWDTRSMWGSIVADARILTSCILEHTHHAPEQRDEAISWLAVFVIAVKQHLRGEKKFNSEEVAGFISSDRVRNMHTIHHPCLYVAANIRHALKNAFQITAETPTALSVVYTSDLRLMEKRIDNLIGLMGGLERVKSTPLPIVFVTHLRTFLMVYLLSMPYLYGHLWGWGTIPAVCITAYILLGIDGSASECESPFRKRPNHLAMENYCLNVLRNIEDLYIENAERRIEERAF